MELVFNLILMAVGGLVLYLGAEGVVRGSAALALRARISPLIVGMTVLALGTSSPELVVTLKAAFSGQGDIAVGSVVGSNISNLALIMGTTVLLRPLAIQRRLLRLDMPIVIFVSLLLAAMLSDGRLIRWEGAVLAGGLVAFLVFNGRKSAEDEGSLPSGPIRLPPRHRRDLPTLPVVFTVVGLGLLVVGAEIMVKGAVAAATLLNVSPAIVGLTLVAVGTSLPELATTTVAVLKAQVDLAIGNLVGSNVLNILGILGLSALLRPLHSPGVASADLAMMIGIVLLALVLMWTGYRLRRWEGALLLSLYAGYIWHLTQ